MSCDVGVNVDRVVTSTVMRLAVIAEAASRLKNASDYREAYEAYEVIKRNARDIAETLRRLTMNCWEIVKTFSVLEAEPEVRVNG